MLTENGRIAEIGNASREIRDDDRYEFVDQGHLEYDDVGPPLYSPFYILVSFFQRTVDSVRGDAEVWPLPLVLLRHRTTPFSLVVGRVKTRARR